VVGGRYDETLGMLFSGKRGTKPVNAHGAFMCSRGRKARRKTPVLGEALRGRNPLAVHAEIDQNRRDRSRVVHIGKKRRRDNIGERSREEASLGGSREAKGREDRTTSPVIDTNGDSREEKHRRMPGTLNVADFRQSRALCHPGPV